MSREGEREGIDVPHEDTVLVGRCVQGEEEAFVQLLDKYKKSIYNFVYRMSYDREAAKDLAQETFIKAFGSLSKYNPELTFSTWLYRIATNLCLDWLRRQHPHHLSLDRPVRIGDEVLKRDIPDPSPSPREELMRKEEKKFMERAIASLPPKYRIPIILRHREGLSYQEMAKVLELPEGTVKVRLFRARELLRKKLKGIEK